MLVDSNILVYSINTVSPKHKPAQKFLLGEASRLYVAQQNFFETLRILTHPKFPNPMSVSNALTAVSQITNALKIISPNYETYYIAIELIRKYGIKSDKVFDAYLAATMSSNKIQTIATDNEKDFKVFQGLKVYNPFRQ